MGVHKIRDRSDIYGARNSIRALAAEVGFDRRACDELAIVVSELSSNILKYGVRGSIQLGVSQPDAGVLIVARDFGPQFHDLAMAVQDGFDDRGPIDPTQMMRRGGFGGGLGAVVRLSHSFHVERLSDGKAIEVTRYLGRPLAGTYAVRR